MFRYGKLARQAVSAASVLAELHRDGVAMSSAEVGRRREIAPAMAAKLLSELASAGLLRGTTGPGGGYRLARPPEQIRLSEIVEIFERANPGSPCPFGPNWCGNGAPCPLHDGFARLEAECRTFLEQTTLAVFANGSGVGEEAKGKRAAAPARRPARR